MTVGARI